MTEPTTSPQEPSINDKINRETARIHWSELAVHFAAGHLITITSELDLITAAKAMAEDNSQQIEHWMQQGHLLKTTDAQAIEWQAKNAELWAVVIKPWVLVQATT